MSAGTEGAIGTQKFDLIIERMWGGLKYAPNHPFELFELLNAAYRLLSDDGVMMIELPTYFCEESGIKVMREFISINKDDNLDLEFYPDSSPRITQILIIRKKNNKARDSLKYVKVSNLIEKNEETFIDFQLDVIEKYLRYLHALLSKRSDNFYDLSESDKQKLSNLWSSIIDLDNNYLFYNHEVESIEKVLKIFKDLDLERLRVDPNDEHERHLWEQAKIAEKKLIKICKRKLGR